MVTHHDCFVFLILLLNTVPLFMSVLKNLSNYLRVERVGNIEHVFARAASSLGVRVWKIILHKKYEI